MNNNVKKDESQQSAPRVPKSSIKPAVSKDKQPAGLSTLITLVKSLVFINTKQSEEISTLTNLVKTSNAENAKLHKISEAKADKKFKAMQALMDSVMAEGGDIDIINSNMESFYETLTSLCQNLDVKSLAIKLAEMQAQVEIFERSVNSTHKDLATDINEMMGSVSDIYKQVNSGKETLNATLDKVSGVSSALFDRTNDLIIASDNVKGSIKEINQSRINVVKTVRDDLSDIKNDLTEDLKRTGEESAQEIEKKGNAVKDNLNNHLENTSKDISGLISNANTAQKSLLTSIEHSLTLTERIKESTDSAKLVIAEVNVEKDKLKPYLNSAHSLLREFSDRVEPLADEDQGDTV